MEMWALVFWVVVTLCKAVLRNHIFTAVITQNHKITAQKITFINTQHASTFYEVIIRGKPICLLFLSSTNPGTLTLLL